MSAPEPGVQNERTALAWQRTALSLMAGSAAVSRLTFGRLGLLALVSVVVALPLTLWVLVESRGRYRRDVGLVAGPARRGGRAPAALAAATTAMALTELAALVLSH